MQEKSYYKYLRESHIDVTDSTDQDSFNEPNAPILNLYSNGDGFSIHDNSALYEVIKIFKDTVDRQPVYFQTVTYAIDVNNKRLVFKIVPQNNHLVVRDAVNGLIDIMKNEIEMYYGETFDIFIEEDNILPVGTDMGVDISSSKSEIRIIVSEKQKDPPKNIE